MKNSLDPRYCLGEERTFFPQSPCQLLLLVTQYPTKAVKENRFVLRHSW